MSADLHRRAKEVFSAAADLPPERRAAHVGAACGDDTELREEVLALLATVETRTASLTGRVAESLLELDVSPDEGPRPVTVGPWLVLDELGRGGMGTVYRVRRADEAHEREAALKLIRTRHASSEVQLRFRVERRVLSALSHPNIASLLDAGSTDDGRPYIVMELVDGEAIDRWCDRRLLRLRDRIELFLRVCDAVRHAHQNLVVHRDVKPSNILVTKDGVPKLLDFGLAELLDAEATPASPEAGPNAAIRIMTPAYASPEHVRGEPTTTSSDVYSLGIVLFLLLTGRHPYGRDASSAFASLEAVLGGATFQPSATFGSAEREDAGTGPSRAARAAARSGTPRSLRRALRGDLDAIVRKALAREPAERYASAADLAADLKAHLRSFAVGARRPTPVYRASRFFRRHRLGVTAAILVAASVLAGVASTERQRRYAEKRYSEVRGLAKSLLFELHDAIRDLPGATSARGLLVRRALEYLDRLSAEARGDEALSRDLADAYLKVGDVQGNPFQANLGDTRGARRSYERAVRLLEPLAAPGAASEESRVLLAEALVRQCGLLSVLADPSAVDKGRRAVALWSDLSNRSPADDSKRLSHAAALRALAFALNAVGSAREALDVLEAHQRVVVPLQASRPADEPVLSEMGLVLQVRAYACEQLGRRDDAVASYERAIALLRPTPGQSGRSRGLDRILAYTLSDFGVLLMRVGRLEDSFAVHREALAIREHLAELDVLDADARRNVAVTLVNLGTSHHAAGHRDDALREYGAALRILEALAASDPGNRYLENVLATLYASLGDAHQAGRSAPDPAACAWFRRCLDRFDELDRHRAVPPFRVPIRNGAAEAWARCRAAGVAGPAPEARASPAVGENAARHPASREEHPFVEWFRPDR